MSSALFDVLMLLVYQKKYNTRIMAIYFFKRYILELTDNDIIQEIN
jgi:hypothetical protein